MKYIGVLISLSLSTGCKCGSQFTRYRSQVYFARIELYLVLKSTHTLTTHRMDRVSVCETESLKNARHGRPGRRLQWPATAGVAALAGVERQTALDRHPRNGRPCRFRQAASRHGSGILASQDRRRRRRAPLWAGFQRNRLAGAMQRSSSSSTRCRRRR